MVPGAKVIDARRNEAERWAARYVRAARQPRGHKDARGRIYEAPEMNAFATGPSQQQLARRVSSGLLQQMRREEWTRCWGTRFRTVANGDMVTRTLIQGVLNIRFFFSPSLATSRFHAARSRRENRGPGMGYWIATFAAEIVRACSHVVRAVVFSRRREFRADEAVPAWGSSQHGQRAKATERQRGSSLPESMAAFGIAPRRSGLWR